MKKKENEPTILQYVLIVAGYVLIIAAMLVFTHLLTTAIQPMEPKIPLENHPE